MKRMVNEAEEVNKLTEFVRQEGKKTIIGGNLEVDGDLTVNGKAPGGGAIYKHNLTVNGYGQNTYTIFYSSQNRKVTSLDDLKILLGSTFILPVSGAISSGALGSGYYFATYLNENNLNVANMSDTKTISYGAITLTDTVTEI